MTKTIRLLLSCLILNLVFFTGCSKKGEPLAPEPIVKDESARPVLHQNARFEPRFIKPVVNQKSTFVESPDDHEVIPEEDLEVFASPYD